jgi:hypothetical protein
MAAYMKIRGFADTKLWRKAFEKEKVNPSFWRLDLIPICYRQTLRKNLPGFDKAAATLICIPR